MICESPSSAKIFHCDCCGITGSLEFILEHLTEDHRFNPEEAENSISPAPWAEPGIESPYLFETPLRGGQSSRLF
jgi:hypothetical protein